MRDIQRAIAVEREYIQYRLDGAEPYSLADAIEDCGFDDLEDYYAVKLDHLVGVLDFYICDEPSDLGAQLTIDATANKIPFAVFCKATSTGVYHGDEDLDAGYCAEHGIPILEYHSSGGNIVITEGDMAIGLSVPVKGVSADYILKHLADIIAKYEDDVCVDRNDIMVGGKKVAGSANYHTESGIGFVIHFSFSDKTDLIRNICTDSPSIKRPGFLERISPEQLRQEVITWLQKP